MVGNEKNLGGYFWGLQNYMVKQGMCTNIVLVDVNAFLGVCPPYLGGGLIFMCLKYRAIVFGVK